MVIDPKANEIRLKLVLVGIPASGKRQILESWSSEQGDGQLIQSRIGDATVYRASFRWSNLPREDWNIKMTAYTTEGELDHSAVNEMLLKDSDGVAFVAPVDGDRAQAISESMAGLGEILRREQRYLSEIPLVLHYHQSERIPGFDANLLSDFLGIPRNAVPHVMTRSDDGSPLTGSLALLLQKVMKIAEASLPKEEARATA
jgi:hypothetical protein